MAQHPICAFAFLLGLTGVQAFTTYYMANHCGSTIFVSYDEQIGVNLTAAQTYNNYMDCHVTFQTSLGKQMKIDVTFIDTEICCDQMTLYDGFYNNGTLLGTYKGNVILNQNTSEYTLGNIVTANFHSDGSGVSRGFEFTITPYHTDGQGQLSLQYMVGRWSISIGVPLYLHMSWECNEVPK